MISTREALLQAVYANLDDDTPKLAFADYLDETDGPAWEKEWARWIRESRGEKLTVMWCVCEECLTGTLHPFWQKYPHYQSLCRELAVGGAKVKYMDQIVGAFPVPRGALQ